MSLTYSNMMPLGSLAPKFNLTNVVNEKKESLHQLKGKTATVIMFICNHCPYVLHLNNGLVKIANDYTKKNINFIAISSNDVQNYPADSPEKMKQHAAELSYPFPYLYDESQEIAKAYDATCTPDFYIFDKNLELVYRGRFDDSSPGKTVAVTGNEMRNALNNIIDNKPVSENQKPSMGCNIKWK